ncbi:MAG: iron-sulfur cluster assembly accessory protein [Pseudomonadota bacterium]
MQAFCDLFLLTALQTYPTFTEITELRGLAMEDFFAQDQQSTMREFHVSPTAVTRLRQIRAAENRPETMLRISVIGGGCAGYQYVFDFDDEARSNDKIFEIDDARVVIDSQSLALLDGSQLDFVDALVGSAFRINNPRSTSGCGCGTSFSLS